MKLIKQRFLLIVYLEKYIDDSLRNEIKMQYRKDLLSPSYESIFLETDDCYSLSMKNQVLISVLGDVLVEVSNNGEALKKLESIKEGIELS